MLKLLKLKYMPILCVILMSGDLYAQTTVTCPESMVCGRSEGSNTTLGPCAPSREIGKDWQGSYMGFMYPVPSGTFTVTFVGATWQEVGAATCWYTSPPDQNALSGGLSLVRYMNPNNFDYASAATSNWDDSLAPGQSSCSSKNNNPADCGFVRLY